MTPAMVPDGTKVLTISELTRELKGLLEGCHPRGVWVSGEASNVARPASGHIYLTLKDAKASLRTVLWAGVSRRLKFELRDGLEVIAFGRLSVFEQRGEYQLYVESMQPKGIGPLELAFQQLREKLFGLGYFDAKRKKPLPRFPRRLALVTSPTGAAVQDMLKVIRHRWPAVEVWVCPVHVQGDGAADEIAAAVRRVNQVGGIDVLIVGRGGGSIEDLWAFNEEVVARAIFESRVPVVSGIGHETDQTIADFVADCRGNTPTDAAARVVPSREELAESLHGLGERVRTLLRRRLDAARTGFERLAASRPFRMPLERIRDQERRLDDWAGRLQRAGQQRVQDARQRLEAHAGRLETLSPLNVLARGYSLTRTDQDQVVRSPAQVRPGDTLVTLVQHGRILSRVEGSGEELRPPAQGRQAHE